MELTLSLPAKLVEVFDGPARYRGAYGGRGSGKTRTFAIMAAARGVELARNGETGQILCGREFMNSLDDSSFTEVAAAINAHPELAAEYDVGERYIRTKDHRIEFNFIGLRHNLDSIKSKAKIHILWVDEAERVSETAWVKAIPTVREENSEIWLCWNPEVEDSPTDQRFRKNPPPNSKIVRMNWRDNPFFPAVLNEERLNDYNDRPDYYPHIWEGEYATVMEGAYFAQQLQDCRSEGRIGTVSRDPLLTLYAYCDIGGAGARADAFVIWIIQFVGNEIRVLDHYETIGQTLDFHVNWMRDNGYERARVILPHDGTNTNNVTGKRYEDHWRDAKFTVETVPNQGMGAAMQRVEATRRVFHRVHFNDETTELGRRRLGMYHEKRDAEGRYGLGPDHDENSHSADAFGLMAIHQTASMGKLPKPRDYKMPRRQEQGSWASW